MNRMKLTGMASAFLLAAATAVSAAPAHKAKEAMHGKTERTGTHKTEHKTEHKADTHKKAMHKAAMHHAIKHKQAMLGAKWRHRDGTKLGDREVFALNALEAAGYRYFKDMRANGSNIAVTTTKKGKNETLLITPAGKVMPKA